MKRIALFASGNGTNAEKIMDYFRGNSQIEIALVVSNKSDANVLIRAENKNVETFVIDKKYFFETEKINQLLDEKKIDWIVLAGFLWMIPAYLIKKFPNKILNIHPALLPKFGGQGMYGMRVHKAVIDANEKVSGITIHFVNEKYDEGKIIFHTTCTVAENETPETLSEKIHQLEHLHFANEIEKIVQQN
ncbi:MAG TPA: phosphoribosylglycinamide formyltransferase [Bacteroidia bacterium]|nr:phosphoribosylglycinamide formyltransferase [Bacteroidia bacterium]